MIDLESLSAGCAVIVDPDGPDGFSHVATAWSLAPGEWVTAVAPREPAPSWRLLLAHSGELATMESWEEDGPLHGFRSVAAPTLTPAEDGDLTKRMSLQGFGYACVIDHPAFTLHHRSLSAELYLPYLCPWSIVGHLVLFTPQEGFLAGAQYPGMAGGPVCDSRTGQVVGVLLPADSDPGCPPLTRFHRLL